MLRETKEFKSFVERADDSGGQIRHLGQMPVLVTEESAGEQQ